VKPAPQVGDQIICSDGYVFEITDVSKYQNSMFATEATDALPKPTCDWSLLDQPQLPEPEANHFTSGGKQYMFVRNLYEPGACSTRFIMPSATIPRLGRMASL
jgi:hypothetical protein